MSKFVNVSGLKQVAEGFKGIATSAGSALEAVGALTPAMGALVGGSIVGGMVKLVTGFADWNRELEKTGLMLDESPERLSGVAQAMRSIGGSADEAIRSLGGLRRAQYDAMLGMNPTAAYTFTTKLGVALTTLQNGKQVFRDVADVQGDVLKKLVAMPVGMDRLNVAMKLGVPELADMANEITAAGLTVDQFMAREKRMQLVTDENRKAYEKNKEAIGNLDAAFYKLGYNVGGTVAPALTTIIDQLSNWVDTHQQQILDGTKELGNDLKWVADNLDTVKTAAEIVGGVFLTLWGVRAVSAVLTLIGQVKALGLALDGVLGPLSIVLGAGAGAYKLGRDIVKGKPEMPGDWSKWLDLGYLGHKLFGGGGGAPGTAPAGAPPAGATPAPAGMAPPGSAPYAYAPIAPAAAAGPGGGEVGSPLGPGATGGGFASIAAQRAPLMAEVNKDPATKQLLMQMMATEGGGAATVEALFNRVAMVRQKVPGYSIKDELNSGFYGPIKRGVAQQRVISPVEAGGFQKTLDQVVAGSNIIQGRTNQGLPTDPGAGAPGGVKAPGSAHVYNYWSGERGGVGFGIGASAEFARQQQRLALGPPAAPNTPGGGAAGDMVDHMVALAGTRGAAVREFLRDPSGKIARDPDLGLWCAEFTNAYLRHAGVPGTGSLMARSFAQWGQEVAKDNLQKGDVLLNLNRAHVGVATGRTWLNTPGHKAGEVEEVSSNTIGPGGQLLNLPGTRWRSDVEVRRSQELAMAEAKGENRAIASTMTPNGNVNVTVTHKNAPAGVQVAATASGSGINVGDTRTEHQHFGNI